MKKVLVFICYNDWCYLKKFAQNPCQHDVTNTANFISNLNIVVIKLHMKGDVDSWCKENYDAKAFEELETIHCVSIISPWYTCTVRVTLHSWYICVCVCLCVPSFLPPYKF